MDWKFLFFWFGVTIVLPLVISDVLASNRQIILLQSEWECTARDARDQSCVEYGLIEFPERVVYNK